MDERLRGLLDALNGEVLVLGLPQEHTLQLLAANVGLVIEYQRVLSQVDVYQQLAPATTTRRAAKRERVASVTE